MFRKNKIAMLVAEFLGTGLLTMVLLGALRSQAGGFFVPVAAGILVVVITLAFAGISGAVINPAITIALWSVRKLRALQAVAYIVAQFAGAAAAWYLFVYITKYDTSMLTHEKVTEMLPRPMIAEAFGTFIFALAIAAAVYQRFRLSTKAWTFGIGLMAGAWVASLAAGGFLNPALAFGLQQWNIWVYMLGPVLGAVLGMNLYNLLFVETEMNEVAVVETELAEARVVSVPSKVTVAKKAPARVKKAPAKKKVVAKK